MKYHLGAMLGIVIAILLIILGFLFTYVIATSDLPMWIKWILLR